MNLHELRSECQRLWCVEHFSDLPVLTTIYKNALFKIILGHTCTQEDGSTTVEAKLIAQMMFTKLAHLEQTCSGIEFKSPDNSAKLNKIIDPLVVGSMVRGIFELAGVFHMIFSKPESHDERLILYNLWVISGLNFRQKFTDQLTLVENKTKATEERLMIQKYIKAIEDTNLYKKLGEKAQNSLHLQITRKKFYVAFDNEKLKVLSGFQEIIELTGLRKKIMGNMYNYFSLNTHPSNVSVFQFGQMFDATNPKFAETTTFHMKNAFILLSVFIADYIKLFPGTLSIFNGLAIRDQIVIDFLNVFGRDDSYRINESLLSLGTV